MHRRLTRSRRSSVARRPLLHVTAAALITLIAACTGVQQPAEAPARQMVAAANPLAAEAGMTMLRQELIPRISVPVAVVFSSYPGASPAVVEQRASEIEERLAALEQAREVTPPLNVLPRETPGVRERG